ncbi:MAG: hypothetical protein GXP27_01590 [Planctomycetes bacterium]|nr:hypothetical protein [Planctomycetota bacterium]
MPAAASEKPTAIDIGTRRELFVDQFLVERLSGDAKLKLQRPTPHEVVLETDRPWEGNTCAYYTIFRDGDLFRMYYRGSHFDEKNRRSAHPEVTCYAESRDGIHWTRPELGLFEFNGSKRNNIVWSGPGSHNFTPFKDNNPQCPPDARYKALAFVPKTGPYKKRGLIALKSADGIHWSLMVPQPVITKGAFDSQNLAFWDAHAGLYREYHRTFESGVRAIMTGTSRDFIHWTDPVLLQYPGAPKQHLYTNAIMPCPRAPHILIGFPTRYLPQEGQRVEPTFMASRDGRIFHRWLDPVIPKDAPKDRAGNRSNYMAWGLVQLPGNDREYSVYATEAYYTGPSSRLRRFTYRVDGFVSLHAGPGGGELVTKPLQFAGKKLMVNFRTESDGCVQVELQTPDGRPIAEFALERCAPLRGDAIDQAVRWKGEPDLAALAGQAIRVRFHLKDADVFSFRFAP